MKLTAASLARAFVETARTLPGEHIPALAEAAAHLLVAEGLFKDAHIFPRLVSQAWLKSDGAVQVQITTADAGSSSLKDEISHIVSAALQRMCSVEELHDPSVLGGVLLQIGDERYDLTLRGALNDLSVRLAAPISLS